MLTFKDKKILDFIKDVVSQTGNAPTVEEIRAHFGYRSLTSVQRSIKSLTSNGYVNKQKNKARGISLIQEISDTVSIPIVGSVACGQPLMAIENIEGYVQTDICFIKGEPSAFFYLIASGDSMNLLGIEDGDLVLIRSQSHAENGDIVVALIDDKATIKVFKKGDTYIKLEPRSSNLAHHPIILRQNFSIQGVVVRVIK